MAMIAPFSANAGWNSYKVMLVPATAAATPEHPAPAHPTKPNSHCDAPTALSLGLKVKAVK